MQSQLGIPSLFITLALLGAGCAMNESLDEDKSAVAAAGSGGADPASSSGGAAGLGAAGAPDDETKEASPSASGGSGSGGAEGDTGGSAGATATCASSEKLCETGCVAKTAEVGCGSSGCTPCNKPPANSKGTCNGALCDFECLPGFTPQGFSCVSTQAAGGSGGSGSGSGGSGGTGANGGSTGGSGGGASVCVSACDPSNPASQFLCVAACVAKGGIGLCAPALNCCVCG